MSQRPDYKNPPVGARYGRLTVLGFGGRYKSRNPKWHCRCDCGRETWSQAYKVAKGMTQQCKSCGGGLRKHEIVHADRDSVFVNLVREKNTFGAVAEMHGVSRSTVAGAIWRAKRNGTFSGDAA